MLVCDVVGVAGDLHDLGQFFAFLSEDVVCRWREECERVQGAFWRVVEYVCGGGAPVLPVLNVGHVFVCDRAAAVFDDDSCH